MRRQRADSILGGLSPEQKMRVDGWLFDRRETYERVVELCREEFGVAVGKSSVSRYYRRERVGRMTGRSAGRSAGTGDPAAMAAQSDRTYLEVIENIGQIVLELTRQPRQETDARDLAYLTKVLIAARREGHEALRAGTTREKFEFDAATECLAHQMEMGRIAGDEAKDDGERILEIRERLFGPNLPK